MCTPDAYRCAAVRRVSLTHQRRKSSAVCVRERERERESACAHVRIILYARTHALARTLSRGNWRTHAHAKRVISFRLPTGSVRTTTTVTPYPFAGEATHPRTVSRQWIFYFYFIFRFCCFLTLSLSLSLKITHTHTQSLSLSLSLRPIFICRRTARVNT